MSSLSTYEQQNILKNLFQGVTMPAAPGTLYVALYTVAPTAGGGGTEVSGGGYGRVAVASTTANWTLSAAGGGGQQVANVNQITFAQATASWGTVVAAALLDASTGGNQVAWGATSSTAVGAGVTPFFAAGNLIVTVN